MAANVIMEPRSSEIRPLMEEPQGLTKWQARAKEISKWAATGLIFAAALVVAGLGAAFGLSVGNVFGLCVISSLIGGFAFSTAFVIHAKVLKLIDDYFDKKAAC